MKKKLFLAVIAATLLTTPVQARELFQLTATLPTETASSSYTEISDLIEAVDNQSLLDLLTTYTPTSQTEIRLDVRGLQAQVNYATASTTLVFEVPSLGIYETFTGATRDESQELFEEYLKNNGNGILTDMLKKLVGTTAVDPVAGNPNSLMAKMGVADFGLGTDLGGAQMGKSQPAQNTLSILGFRFGSYSAGPYTQDVYTWPINYTYRFKSDPRKQLMVDIPITYIDTEGSRGYSSSLGVAFRYPITDNWSLTPALRVGGAGSIDQGSAAIIYSGSLVSNLNVFWGKNLISIGNMVAQYQTESIEIDEYSIDYDLTNTMIKNGIGIATPLSFKLFGKNSNVEFDVAHTAFFGDDIYIDSYFDFAISFGTHGTETELDNIRAGITYTVGNNSYDGFMFNVGYTF